MWCRFFNPTPYKLGQTLLYEVIEPSKQFMKQHLLLVMVVTAGLETIDKISALCILCCLSRITDRSIILMDRLSVACPVKTSSLSYTIILEAWGIEQLFYRVVQGSWSFSQRENLGSLGTSDLQLMACGASYQWHIVCVINYQ